MRRAFHDRQRVRNEERAELFLADHDRCGGLEVRTCQPTSAVGDYLALTCRCGGFRIKWAMSEHALFKLVWPIQPFTSN